MVVLERLSARSVWADTREAGPPEVEKAHFGHSWFSRAGCRLCLQGQTARIWSGTRGRVPDALEPHPGRPRARCDTEPLSVHTRSSGCRGPYSQHRDLAGRPREGWLGGQPRARSVHVYVPSVPCEPLQYQLTGLTSHSDPVRHRLETAIFHCAGEETEAGRSGLAARSLPAWGLPAGAGRLQGPREGKRAWDLSVERLCVAGVGAPEGPRGLRAASSPGEHSSGPGRGLFPVYQMLLLGTLLRGSATPRRANELCRRLRGGLGSRFGFDSEQGAAHCWERPPRPTRPCEMPARSSEAGQGLRAERASVQVS